VRYWIETLGARRITWIPTSWRTPRFPGYQVADSPEEAELVVANTCAFIEAAREESIEAVLELAERKLKGARLIVTGCMPSVTATNWRRRCPKSTWSPVSARVSPFSRHPCHAAPANDAGLRPLELPRPARRRRGPT